MESTDWPLFGIDLTYRKTCWDLSLKILAFANNHTANPRVTLLRSAWMRVESLGNQGHSTRPTIKATGVPIGVENAARYEALLSNIQAFADSDDPTFTALFKSCRPHLKSLVGRVVKHLQSVNPTLKSWTALSPPLPPPTLRNRN